MDTDAQWYIGKAAKQTGASAKAIRIYEKMKLIPAPERKGSYRIYTEKHIERIRMIKQAQALGFTLKEIKQILGDKALDCNIVPWDEIMRLLEDKIADNCSDISRLEEQNTRLLSVLDDIKHKKNSF